MKIRNTLHAGLSQKTPEKLVVKTELNGVSKELFFESNKHIWDHELKSLDFILVALSHYASALDCDLHIQGTVTRSQLENIDEFIQVWSVWKPGVFNKIKIFADHIVQIQNNHALPAVMAFSGGVDASFSLVGHKQKLFGHLSRNIALGVLVIGWDISRDDEKSINLAFGKARDSLNEFGADCITIATNWRDDFCPDWLMGHNIGIASVLQTLSDCYACGVFSSDMTYLQELAIGPYGMHLGVNRLLGSTRFPLVISGGMHSRFERVGVLSNHPSLLKNLRVCYQDDAGGGNCGVCGKCVRTQLELIAYGVDPSPFFSEPVTHDSIHKTAVKSVVGFTFLDEIQKRFPKNHAFYPSICDATLREKTRLYPANDYPALLNRDEISINELSGKIRELENSRSWKITKPIRVLSRLLRSLRTG